MIDEILEINDYFELESYIYKHRQQIANILQKELDDTREKKYIEYIKKRQKKNKRNYYIQRIMFSTKVTRSILKYCLKGKVDNRYFSLRAFEYAFSNIFDKPCMLNVEGYFAPQMKDVIEDLIQNHAKLLKTYTSLNDTKSKQIFINLIKYRLTRNEQLMLSLMDSPNLQYFDKDIISQIGDGVFVDCGGYVGDTTSAFASNNPEKRKIVLYEPDQGNIQKAKKLLKSTNNICFKDCGVSNINGQAYFCNENSSESAISDKENGNTKISLVTIDEDIREKIAFIKIDIEGEEYKALQGTKEHIINDKPILAIAIYHRIDDLWKIHNFIDELMPKYDFYLRIYSDCWMEAILYAIPRA